MIGCCPASFSSDAASVVVAGLGLFWRLQDEAIEEDLAQLQRGFSRCVLARVLTDSCVSSAPLRQRVVQVLESVASTPTPAVSSAEHTTRGTRCRRAAIANPARRARWLIGWTRRPRPSPPSGFDDGGTLSPPRSSCSSPLPSRPHRSGARCPHNRSEIISRFATRRSRR